MARPQTQGTGHLSVRGTTLVPLKKGTLKGCPYNGGSPSNPTHFIFGSKLWSDIQLSYDPLSHHTGFA